MPKWLAGDEKGHSSSMWKEISEIRSCDCEVWYFFAAFCNSGLINNATAPTSILE
jgi:hypothetical protein